MEVLFRAENKRLVMRDALDLVSPLPRDFDGCLDSLSSSVHGKHHVEAKKIRDILGESREYIVVEGSAAKRQSRSLLGQGFDEFWVAMTLVNSTVRR